MIKSRPFTCPGGAQLRFGDLGFGGAAVGNQFRAVPMEQVNATLAAAWAAGIRIFDTAPHYGLGLSESRIGEFLRTKPRDEFVLSTKVGRILVDCAPEDSTPSEFADTPSRRRVWDFSYDGFMRSLDASLGRLGLDRVDVLLCHDLDDESIGSEAEFRHCEAQFWAGGYRALRELRDQGVIKAIGAGLNHWQVAEAMAEKGDFDLFLLAGRYTLLEQEALQTFLPLCEKRGIGILLGGPFNSGILATGAIAGAMYNYAPAPQPVLDRVDRIAKACAAHGVPLADAALQFPLAHKAVVSVVAGAKSPAEIDRNVASLATKIPAGLWADLRSGGLLRADAPVPA